MILISLVLLVAGTVLAVVEKAVAGVAITGGAGFVGGCILLVGGSIAEAIYQSRTS